MIRTTAVKALLIAAILAFWVPSAWCNPPTTTANGEGKAIAANPDNIAVFVDLNNRVEHGRIHVVYVNDNRWNDVNLALQGQPDGMNVNGRNFAIEQYKNNGDNSAFQTTATNYDSSPQSAIQVNESIIAVNNTRTESWRGNGPNTSAWNNNPQKHFRNLGIAGMFGLHNNSKGMASLNTGQ
ncbi:MAG: hypothetical protein PHS53_04645 [Candidatus Pacebacteria bacterium]|nr:hypothetical protein [Candidatus Paceibacterota bacterium]MDD5357407.1 hypothetical protein [Candidatus Paceibacterota bacterium]